MTRHPLIASLIAGLCALSAVVGAAEPSADGKAIYEKTCAACHTPGLAGAPKLGDAQEWKTRANRGAGALFLSAFRGKNAMPPKGGNAALSNVEVEAAVVYLVSQSTGIPAAKVATLPASTEAARAAAAPPNQPAQAAKPAQGTSVAAGDGAKGKRVYETACAACHATGAAGAPKLGDADAWRARLKAGMRALYDSALKGKNAMPPKGGNASLPEADVTAAVSYMVSRVSVSDSAPAKEKEAKRDAAPNAAAIASSKPPAAPPAGSQGSTGKAVYQATCAACHTAGLAGAPKLADAAAWQPRVKSGKSALYASALGGKNAMPAKGGNAALSDGDVKAAVDFMLTQLKEGDAGTQGATTALASSNAPEGKKLDASALSAQVASGGAAADPNSAEPAPKTPLPGDSNATESAPNLDGSAVLPSSVPNTATSAVAQTAAPSAAPSTAAAADPNAFNRLLKPAGKRNLSAAESGIHDPSNDATHMLQAPLQAFGTLPRSNAGNQVDWVKALNEGKINPRMDKTDAAVEPLVLDMNIVREVKGSMPDVVYPHKQHTQWLDCSNCHPAIFIPQKGANQISMAAILLGQKCGVCHGKVAFPVSECRLCHSKNKETKVGETKP